MPIRTEHVGSMIRPAKLLDARDARKAGRISLDDLRRVEDECILEALDLQRQAGIDVYTDGEMRRDAYTTDLYDAVEGFAPEYPVREETRPDGTKVMIEYHSKPVIAKLHKARRMTQHESSFLLRHAPGAFKMTLATPVRPRQESVPPPYGSWEEVQQDLADIFRSEMEALVAEGVTYVQLDKVPSAYINEEGRERLRRQGIDPVRALQAEIDLENQCYDAVRREGVTLAIHLCRGNRVAWSGASGGYDWPAELLFNGLHVDRFLLEYDTERAGGFEPLRHVPKDKSVLLGLLTTKSNRMESQDDLLRRIDEASKYVDLDRLALGPQCGFQSSATRDGANMTIDEERRKLDLVVDTARKVWG